MSLEYLYFTKFNDLKIITRLSLLYYEIYDLNEHCTYYIPAKVQEFITFIDLFEFFVADLNRQRHQILLVLAMISEIFFLHHFALY